MATLLLSAAGTALGGSFGGSLLGLTGSVLGKALGGVAGSLLDQRLLGGGSEPVEVGRVSSFRMLQSAEGGPIARLSGRMRVAGHVIWSTRFKETVRRRGGSGKGAAGSGPAVREYSYSISLAIALCEGEIVRIGRVWADGKPFALETVQYRVYRGSETQAVDPLIEVVEGTGNAPAYRGTAYVVFEDLDVGDFGNRIPQFNVEVFRQPAVPATYLGEIAPRPQDVVRGVALTPGTGEYALAPDPVSLNIQRGESRFANVTGLSGETDFVAAMAQLKAELPICDAVSLVVSWFGSDLRCGSCRIEPKVEQRSPDSDAMPWRVSGLGRGDAGLVSRAEDRPNFGGTPSDQSVVAAIRRLRAEGKRVMFYPFVLMDIPADNTLPDPWSGAPSQPAFPWRGRITLPVAPGRPGSLDRQAGARAEVQRFFGTSTVEMFAAGDDTVGFTGAEDWGFRRFVLHYARLCALAGGVDAFCIGSELRSLTQIRDGAQSYPAVDALRTLASDVRAILGPQTKIGYAADWSEYFGHQPGDGTGDVFFHLDPLWADTNIDFVGVDNYMPLSDWRDEPDQLDGAAPSIYDLAYLQRNIAGGEGFDWYYASDADRTAQVRTPIVDTAHGESWLFRVKDLVNWWSQPHRNRPAGVRSASTTPWVPRSKPIWFTELGCPAVDKGTNQPNVFIDPKSSESFVPYFSSGQRDDYIQLRYLQAQFGYWADSANNPTSPVYGGRMVDLANAYVWAWDARPWPDFPNRVQTWADGPNYARGHWISGRLGAATLAETVAEICLKAGLSDFDVTGLRGLVTGYLLETAQSARQSLQPLMLAYGFDAIERDGQVVFRMRDGGVDLELTPDLVALGEDDETASGVSRSRAPGAEVPEAVRVSFVEAENDYQLAAAEASHPDAALPRANASELPIAFAAEQGQIIAERWLAEGRVARDGVRFALPPSLLRIEPGDVVRYREGRHDGLYRVHTAEEAGVRRLEAQRFEVGLYGPGQNAARSYAQRRGGIPAQVYAALMDLPLLRGDEVAHAPWLAVSATPWPGPVAAYVSSTDDGYSLNRVLNAPSIVAQTLSVLSASAPWLWSRGDGVIVRLSQGALEGRADIDVLNGANVAAIRASDGASWEIIQFRDAELIGTRTYRLTGILRGQAGTEFLCAAAIPAGAEFILLDGGPMQLDLPSSARGLSRHYRIGPSSRGYDDPSYMHLEQSFAGVGLRPYAPVHLRARVSTDGTVAVTWVRRTRSDGDSWESAEVPLGEDEERYSIFVRIGGAVRRSASVTTPLFTYTAAMRAEDGADGPFTVEVAQVSVQYGQGPITRMDVDD